MNYKDKVVIITGAGGGIGLATATRFANLQANIVLVDIDAEQLQKTAATITATGSSEVLPLVCDVTVEAAVQKVVEDTMRRWGRLDVVVNNAGLMIFKPIEEQTLEDWIKVFSVDLFGAFFFIKHAFKTMKAGGAIVNVSSIHALVTEPMVAPYAAAKAALLSLTRSASLEGKPKGIRVNAILPGAIDTPMLWSNPNVKAGIEKINKKDVGKPEDIANAIAYLGSPEAAFIQGAMLTVDGGRLDRL
ncbi:MAG TPA: SDR family oxidoreductase [Chitinophagaceae bacterium]|nr:SDR family oxidoreductase [Chitinophagaceae bacterium]